MGIGRLLVGVVGAGLLAFVTAAPAAGQEIPARGLASLVCALGVQGNGTYSSPGAGQISVVVSGDAVIAGVGTATVAIQHGASGSTHDITYLDNGNSLLDCGDQITTVQ
jgi:hypothetical protein